MNNVEESLNLMLPYFHEAGLSGKMLVSLFKDMRGEKNTYSIQAYFTRELYFTFISNNLNYTCFEELRALFVEKNYKEATFNHLFLQIKPILEKLEMNSDIEATYSFRYALFDLDQVSVTLFATRREWQNSFKRI